MTADPEALLWPGLVVAGTGVPGGNVVLLVAGFTMVGVAVLLALPGVVRGIAGWWRYDWRYDVRAACDDLSAGLLDQELRELLAQEEQR